LGAQDGVEDDEELAHATGDGDFRPSAAADQTPIEGFSAGLWRMAVKVGV
jgi:hypothetical protein